MAKWKVSCSDDGKTWKDAPAGGGYDLSEYAQQTAQNPYPHLKVGSPVFVDDRPKPDSVTHPKKTTPRADLLSEAIEVTTGDRARDYGDTVSNMNRVAAIFNAMTGRDLKGSEVAELLMALKIARMQVTREHRDSHVDLMAYAGIRYECACAERVDRADKI